MEEVNSELCKAKEAKVGCHERKDGPRMPVKHELTRVSESNEHGVDEARQQVTLG